MPKQIRKLHLHLVSDATGETTHQLGRAALAQFENVQTIEHVWTLVRTPEHLKPVADGISKYGGVVMFSIADSQLRTQLEQICNSHAVPHVSVLDHAVHTVASVLGKPDREVTAGQHRMDKAYFDRISALDFAISHDDGQGIATVGDADILLVGVSRSSKTPTSIYLANRGYKSANVPLVPGLDPPAELLDADRPLVVGLINSPERLRAIRRNRLLSLNEDSETEYVDPELIRDEIAEARRLFARQQWPVIDVTRRSVEEIASAILNLHQEHERMRDARP